MSIYDDLPDDNEAAFLALEEEYRLNFTDSYKSNDDFSFHASNYMNQVIAAAQALEIAGIMHSAAPSTSSDDFISVFEHFQGEVDRLRVISSIRIARRAAKTAVGLTPEQRGKLHQYLEKIREEVDQSNASIPKKERIFKIIANLALEIDKPRSQLERVGDLAKGLAGISKEFAENGAEPWFKWLKAVLRIADEADEAKRLLTQGEPTKRLPPPSSPEFDDDIPF